MAGVERRLKAHFKLDIFTARLKARPDTKPELSGIVLIGFGRPGWRS
jgi:hypothetical protein